MVNKYGEAPGNYLSAGHNGEPSLAIARLQFGNIVLFPQPHAAEGDDEFQIVHGASVAPPHAYIAPYLWVQNEFKADALVHFMEVWNLHPANRPVYPTGTGRIA